MGFASRDARRTVLSSSMRSLFAAWMAAACVGCALFSTGGRYGPRDKNCVVKTLQTAPKVPVDDLGIVSVDCWAGNDDGCQQEVLDEVCRRGGDIVWGLGDPAPHTSKIAVHVARTRHVESEAK
jgi:hypothetical protein